MGLNLYILPVSYTCFELFSMPCNLSSIVTDKVHSIKSLNIILNRTDEKTSDEFYTKATWMWETYTHQTLIMTVIQKLSWIKVNAYALSKYIILNKLNIRYSTYYLPLVMWIQIFLYFPVANLNRIINSNSTCISYQWHLI